MSSDALDYEVLRNDLGAGNPITHLVRVRGTSRFLGGFGANFYRPWVFPLYTPGGLCVLQEFPFDHPFHNGIFVGQHPVRVDASPPRQANFWAAPPRRSFNDPVWVNVGRMDAQQPPRIEAGDNVLRFTLQSIWRDADEQPVLAETRSVEFSALAGATICRVTSQKRAAFSGLEFPQTKYGSIGARLEPRLLPALGGVVLADTGRRGTAAGLGVIESNYVAYESDAPGGHGRFGLMLAVPGSRGPWFIRDYGMAMHNPTLNSTISLTQGQAWTVALSAVAYEGELTPARAREFVGV